MPFHVLVLMYMSFILFHFKVHAPSVDLEPTRLQKSFSSLLSSGPADLKARVRKLELTATPNQVTALEICNNKILVDLKSGEINVCNSTDLQCKTTLRYCNNQASFLFLQWTCNEVIVQHIWERGGDASFTRLIEFDTKLKDICGFYLHSDYIISRSF